MNASTLVKNPTNAANLDVEKRSDGSMHFATIATPTTAWPSISAPSAAKASLPTSNSTTMNEVTSSNGSEIGIATVQKNCNYNCKASTRIKSNHSWRQPHQRKRRLPPRRRNQQLRRRNRSQRRIGVKQKSPNYENAQEKIYKLIINVFITTTALNQKPTNQERYYVCKLVRKQLILTGSI